MSPHEILADLRDIQPPAPLAESLPNTLAPEPFYALAAVLAVLAFIWWRRANAWRAEGRRALAAALGPPDIRTRWDALIRLLRQVARHRHVVPPEAVFLPPDRIGEAEVAELAAHIRRCLGWFRGSAGPLPGPSSGKQSTGLFPSLLSLSAEGGQAPRFVPVVDSGDPSTLDGGSSLRASVAGGSPSPARGGPGRGPAEAATSRNPSP